MSVDPGAGPAHGPRRWRILRDPPASGAWNMAMDVALARCLPEGEGVLRIYRWARPTLSLGRNQPARGRYDPLAAESMGVDVVRRPTGGREVLHDRELTYSVLVPVRALGGALETRNALSRALLDALGSLGVQAEIADAGAGVPGLDAGSCFGRAAPGEISAQGRKLVGSAQARVGRVLLQHGSLLLAPASVGLESLRAPAPAREGGSERTGPGRSGTGGRVRLPGERAPVAIEPDPRTRPDVGRDQGITLEEILPRAIGFGEVTGALEAAVAGAFGGRWSRGEAGPEVREVAASLLPRYESFSWTWRR